MKTYSFKEASSAADYIYQNNSKKDILNALDDNITRTFKGWFNNLSDIIYDYIFAFPEFLYLTNLKKQYEYIKNSFDIEDVIHQDLKYQDHHISIKLAAQDCLQNNDFENFKLSMHFDKIHKLRILDRSKLQIVADYLELDKDVIYISRRLKNIKRRTLITQKMIEEKNASFAMKNVA